MLDYIWNYIFHTVSFNWRQNFKGENRVLLENDKGRDISVSAEEFLSTQKL